ncbi:MAG: STAS domain-containing protein [Bryobacteraceae bacterium]
MSPDDLPRPEVRVFPGRRSGVVILAVNGPLTIHNFFEFQDATRRDSPVTIVDLAQVPFLDSAALGCLVGLHVSCERGRRKYAIVNIQERLKSIFHMTGLSDFLVIYPALEDAENALAPA